MNHKVDEIITEVCRHFGVEPYMVKSKSRKHKVCVARRACIHFICELTILNQEQIGTIFNKFRSIVSINPGKHEQDLKYDIDNKMYHELGIYLSEKHGDKKSIAMVEKKENVVTRSMLIFHFTTEDRYNFVEVV